MVRIAVGLLLLLLLPLPAMPQSSQLRALVDSTEHAYNTNADSLLALYAEAASDLAIKEGNINARIKVRRLLAVRLYLNGQSDTAIQILLSVAREAEKKPVTIESAELYYAIAQVYSKNEYAAVSEQYLRKGVEIAQNFKDNIVLADGNNRIGIMLERRGQYDSALYHYRLALAGYDSMGVLLGKSYSLENIAGIYTRRHQMSEALAYQKEALGYRISSGKLLDVAIAYINVGELYDSLKQYDSSILYVNKALVLARDIDYKDLVSYAYQYLSMVYKKLGDYKTSLDFHERYTVLSDSIYNEARARQLAEFDKKYQTEKHVQQIRQLTQRTIIQFIAIGLLLAVVAIGYLIYNRRQLKAKARLQEEINRQQIITAREVLKAEERERKRIATDLHDGVGQLLSASLMNLNSLFARLNITRESDANAGKALGLVSESYEELRAISHRMMPKALAKSGLETAVEDLISGIDGNKMAVTFEAHGLSERLEEDVETVLYRVIQESVNNVIKHADARSLHIQVSREDDGITATIEDDGKGFDSRKVKQSGIGLKNMNSRIQFHKGTIDIDSQPGKGTLVAVFIPLAGN